MNFRCPSIFLFGLTTGLALISSNLNLASVSAVENCSTPALSRIKKHQISPGETLVTIAERYKLMPATILKINPLISNGQVIPGTELQIPPFDGMVVQVRNGQSWQQIAKKYSVRPDTLFELNGCQQNPRVVFVPSSSKIKPTSRSAASMTTIMGSPISHSTGVSFPYGWQIHPITKEVFFHSGVDLLAEVGTPVRATASGVVVFAKEQGTYGNLVIINHESGIQTRYAQLESIKVKLGEQVKVNQVLGTVGATGQPSSREPHLHFEVRAREDLGWTAKDPVDYLR
ncbi:LysM peptidoglycan-binding domain-containing M23 family metallopeptidase [Cylindrospermopsis raciborskii]|uniref:Peptidase n=1 Tax=Cylindrospermopsis raciborskii CENA302 TaxID=1170768 RepID=A0A9Q5QXA6_9CYAN|nr:M23 family metallopeptidase [Cylindrospermopsis raciborskii]NLQ04313.1 M23 family metallopeptidase [Cylindrospermopsis raciborskii MVCC19]OHY33178.1 peptidase [Cylindrospermopsis raciborskii MVCC14]OPH10253.1 peptidase [Cylindrospermopsis raciborskii CENA302]